MRLCLGVVFVVALLPVSLLAQNLPLGRPVRFSATAYALGGPAKSGTAPRPGTVAADTDLLPLGTRVRISAAGRYSGVYTVTDTGRKVQGREVDLYLPTTAHAKRFGRKSVRLTVLKWGSRK